MVFNFSKKDSITGLALSRNMKNGVWQRSFAEGVLFFWELQGKIFEFLFIANLQAFLVKMHIYFNLFIVGVLLFYNSMAIF